MNILCISSLTGQPLQRWGEEDAIMMHWISKVWEYAELIIPPGRSRGHREKKLNLKQVPGKPSNDCLKYLKKMQANRGAETILYVQFLESNDPWCNIWSGLGREGNLCAATYPKEEFPPHKTKKISQLNLKQINSPGRLFLTLQFS